MKTDVGVVAYVVGQLVLARAAPQTQSGSGGKYWALVVGALIYEILRAIPVIGWIVGALVTLCGLGAILLFVRGRVRPQAAAPSREEVAVKVE